MSQMPAFVKNGEWNSDTMELLRLQQDNFNLTEKIDRATNDYCTEMYGRVCNNNVNNEYLQYGLTLLNSNGNTSFTSSDIDYLKETNRIMQKWVSEAPQLLTILQQDNFNLIDKIERGIAYCNEMYKGGECS